MHTKKIPPTVFYGGRAGYIAYQAQAGGEIQRSFDDRHDGFAQIVDLIGSGHFDIDAGISLVVDMARTDKALRKRRARDG